MPKHPGELDEDSLDSSHTNLIEPAEAGQPTRVEAPATVRSDSFETIELPSAYRSPQTSRRPIVWHVGKVDQRFALSAQDVKGAVERAVAIWENAAGKKLFEYSPSAGLPVSLIFDERQQRLNESRAASSALDQFASRLASAKAESGRAMRTYHRESSNYDAEVDRYNAAMDSLNARVRYWNDSGGAPDSIYDDLETEKRRLRDRKAELEIEQASLDRLKSEANELVDRYNGMVEDYNTNVSLANSKFGVSRETVLGECLSKGDASTEINIYAFRSRDHLAIVLAHELGHAIGLEHVEGDGSLMSAVEKGKRASSRLVLSNRDRAALHDLLANASR